MKYEKNFIKPRISEEIKYHNSSIMDKIGLSYVFLDDSVFPGAGLRMTGRWINGVPEDIPSYVEPHTHDVDQIFLFLSGPEKTETLEIDFTFEDETTRIKSPVAVFVPKGVPHTQRIVSGSGMLITILKKGSYP